jgi:hypothetical protein
MQTATNPESGRGPLRGLDLENPSGEAREAMARWLRSLDLSPTRGRMRVLTLCIEAFMRKNPRETDSSDPDPRKRYAHLPFIPARSMQRLTDDYRTIRDASCELLGYSNRHQGFCDRIVGWKDGFLALVWELVRVVREEGTTPSTPGLRPGADWNLYSAGSRSNRLYHPAQSLPSSVKRLIYGGCWDVDIVACHPRLLRRALLGRTEENLRSVAELPLLREAVEDPEAFLTRLQGERWGWWGRLKGACGGRKIAKVMRARLLNPPSEGKLRRTGVGWYDELAAQVSSAVRELARLEGWSTPHLLLTALEREVILAATDAVGSDKVVLNMHDGLVLTPQAAPDAQSLATTLMEATGLAWKVRVL